MSYYGYITDNTYQVADTAITWDFVRYDEEETPFSYVGIETLVEIDSTKVVMFETGQSFNNWRFQFEPETPPDEE